MRTRISSISWSDIESVISSFGLSDSVICNVSSNLRTVSASIKTRRLNALYLWASRTNEINIWSWIDHEVVSFDQIVQSNKSVFRIGISVITASWFFCKFKKINTCKIRTHHLWRYDEICNLNLTLIKSPFSSNNFPRHKKFATWRMIIGEQFPFCNTCLTSWWPLGKE